MPSGSPTKRQVAEALFKIGAVRFGKFTLASGKTSSYYLDLRTVPSHPEAYSLVVEAYKEAVRKFAESAFDVIAGVATAGVTISSPLAFLLKKPMVYVRKEEKGHGMGKLVMGAVQRGSRALVVDDVATTGGSILSAVEALRSEGVVVEKALVLVDRLEGGSESLRSAGVELVSVLDMKELAKELYGSKLVGREEYDSIVAEASGESAER